MRIYYFGVKSNTEKGHFFFKESFIESYSHSFDDFDKKVERVFRNIPDYDGGLCPQKINQIQGKAKLNHIKGLTILSFWDRSGDGRGNSNSNFIVCGTKTFDEILKKAKEAFPSLFERFDFEITETGS